MNLYKINLNLLVAFDALLSERHVTRAGDKVCISQSAMSNALNNLREIFNDEILVRTPQGMQPTPRALELIGDVRDVLQRTDAIFSGQKDFDPKKAERTFTIGMSDYTALILLPALTEYLDTAAPNVKIYVHPLNFLQNAEPLDNASIDLAVGFFETAPEKLYRQLLFREDALCVGWNKNPLIKTKLTLKQFLSAKHIAIQYKAFSSAYLVDELLTSKGHGTRNVVLTVPHAVLGLSLLPGTELITISGKRLFDRFKPALPIKSQPPPIPFPQIPVYQIWHPRFHKDPAHQWLRETLYNL